jgi:nitroreductase
MDTWLAVASRRETREYADRPIAADVVRTILDAGRLAGSGSNKQPWRFLLVESADARARLAEAVFAPTNVQGAQVVIAIVGRSSFDTGRCAQNMLLAAWNAGVGGCPNGQQDPEVAQAALGLGEETIATILTFGYPARPRDPEKRTPEEWSARANRKPLDELVERI